MDQDIISAITLYALPIVLAVTLHEAAHGWAAYKFGDRTAYMMGRITANPLKHIDLVGTVILPIALLVMQSPFMFGWAKPVPVNTRNFKHMRRDMMWVAAAGPIANILMMLAWALLLKLALLSNLGEYNEPLQEMAAMGVFVNTLLAAFNLIPLPPLDGGRIVTSLLPYPWDARFASIERFGFLILLGLMVSGLLNFVLMPLLGLVGAIQHLII